MTVSAICWYDHRICCGVSCRFRRFLSVPLPCIRQPTVLKLKYCFGAINSCFMPPNGVDIVYPCTRNPCRKAICPRLITSCRRILLYRILCLLIRCKVLIIYVPRACFFQSSYRFAALHGSDIFFRMRRFIRIAHNNLRINITGIVQLFTKKRRQSLLAVIFFRVILRLLPFHFNIPYLTGNFSVFIASKETVYSIT